MPLAPLPHHRAILFMVLVARISPVTTYFNVACPDVAPLDLCATDTERVAAKNQEKLAAVARFFGGARLYYYHYSFIRCWLQLLTPMSDLVTIRSMSERYYTNYLPIIYVYPKRIPYYFQGYQSPAVAWIEFFKNSTRG